MRLRLIASTAAAAAISITAVGGIIGASSRDEPLDVATSENSGQDSARSPSSSIAEVERRTLTQSKEFNAKVSYGESFALPISATGTITNRPEKGSVIQPGEELVRVDNKPVFLADGAFPMYRELKKFPDVKVTGQTYTRGYDVAHLQQFLINAGVDDAGKLTVTGDFGPSTERAVKVWQKSVGLRVTGKVDRSQLIIHPEPVRIDSKLRVGASFESLTVSAVDQTLTFNVATRDRGLIAVGGSVDIAAPDGTIVSGTVTALERSIDEQGSSVIEATVGPDQPLPADVTTAVVTATDTLANDVLAVPVRALLAVSQGGFAVEMTAPVPDGGGRLVGVEVGAVADGWAEVTGDVHAGDQVVTAE